MKETFSEIRNELGEKKGIHTVFVKLGDWTSPKIIRVV